MSKKKHQTVNIQLDSYEQEIEDALPETLEKLTLTKNLAEELIFSKKAAANYLHKEAEIQIKLTHFDIEGLQRLAVRDGLPYQTLITSILHQYVTHHL